MKNDIVSIKKIIIWGIGIFIFGIAVNYFFPNIINQNIYIFLKDLITFVFTGTGLYIANGGLFTWRKQTKNETADNLHLSLLRLRDAIKHVRNPAIFPSESYKAIQYARSKYPDKTESELKTNVYPYVYEMRWDEITNAATELESNLLKAEVLWGPAIHSIIKPIYTKITDLNIALKQNFNPELRTKDDIEIHDLMYDKADWVNDKEDKFGKDILNVIKNVKSYIDRQVN